MVYKRMTAVPDRSFFLFGVRGVGKSYWARTVLAEAPRIDLLDEQLFQELLVHPAAFGDLLGAMQPRDWVVVDEIQRIPGLLNEVHRLIEERGLSFALLGSSARKLKTAGTNLLAGRALRKTMYPLTPFELGTDFDFERVLCQGSIPLVWTAASPRETLHSYVQLYLREEIRAEALVRNLPGFIRFLPVAALMHGQLVNVSGIARDAGVARTTVNGYLDILEDTLLVHRLPAFEAKLRIRERKHPKLYWVDPGLVRAVKRQFGPPAPEEGGALFEGWVHGLLRAHDEGAKLFDDIHYWSPTGASVEVDFLLRRGNEFLAIETKLSDRYNTTMLGGLRAISDLQGIARRILVFNGRRSFLTTDGIEIWTVSRLLGALASGELWP